MKAASRFPHFTSSESRRNKPSPFVSFGLIEKLRSDSGHSPPRIPAIADCSESNLICSTTCFGSEYSTETTMNPLRFASSFLPTPPTLAGAADWPEFRGPERKGVWQAEVFGRKFRGTFSTPFRRVWTAPIGAGYSGRTIAGDGVYLMDRAHRERRGSRARRLHRPGHGRPKWVHSYPCVYEGIDDAFGPRTSVTVRDGAAFALGMTGASPPRPRHRHAPASSG